MKTIIEIRFRTMTNGVERVASGVFAVGESRRDMHAPIGKACVDRLAPVVDAGLAGVELLTSTDQTHDDSPVRMAIQVRDQKLRLRLREIGDVLLATHKTRGLPKRPCALRLIEYSNVFCRRAGINNCVIAEMMDVLDECLHAFADLPFANQIAKRSLPRALIAGQRFSKHRDETAIAGQISRWRGHIDVSPSRGDIQSDERFSSARHSCEETDHLASVAFRFVDDAFASMRGDAKILSSGIVSRDRFHRVLSIESACRLDDRRRRTVW